MKGKTLSIILAAAMITSVFAGCQSSTTPDSSDQPSTETTSPDTTVDDATSSGYTGNLEIMHYSTSEESEGNGGSDGFRTMLTQWTDANPNVTLTQSVLANAEYKTQIATLAAANDLPDVFLLQGMNTIDWAAQGLVLDLTENIKSSPYYDDYNQAYFTPFTVDDKIYGYPALTGGTCTVVVYDKAMWKEAGYDSFPTTWEEVEAASAYFAGNNVSTIAFGNGGKWQANSCFLSTLGNRYTGKEWFQGLIDGTGSSFTDETFVASLAETQRLFNQTNIFNSDFNAVTNEDAREYYIAGTAAAFIGGNWDESYIAATLQADDEEKWNNMGFAVLPQPSDATQDPNSQNIGLGYAISISPKVADEAGKLDVAIDLAQYLTGPEFATFVAENYALGGLTAVENVDLSGFDPVTQAFYNYSYVDTTACEIYDSYVNSAVWDVLNTDLQDLMNGDKTAEDVAAAAQAAYQENYLK